MLFTPPIINEFHAALAYAIRRDGEEAETIRDDARGQVAHRCMQAGRIRDLNGSDLPGFKVRQDFGRVL